MSSIERMIKDLEERLEPIRKRGNPNENWERFLMECYLTLALEIRELKEEK